MIKSRILGSMAVHSLWDLLWVSIIKHDVPLCQTIKRTSLCHI